MWFTSKKSLIHDKTRTSGRIWIDIRILWCIKPVWPYQDKIQSFVTTVELLERNHLSMRIFQLKFLSTFFVTRWVNYCIHLGCRVTSVPVSSTLAKEFGCRCSNDKGYTDSLTHHCCDQQQTSTNHIYYNATEELVRGFFISENQWHILHINSALVLYGISTRTHLIHVAMITEG